MTRNLKRFSEADIEQIRLLASWNHSADAIGKVLGRDPLSIRKKCCALGIKLRKPRPDSRRIKLSPCAWSGLSAEARLRNTSPGRLARQLLEIVVRDKLFLAVIDPPPAMRHPIVIQCKADPRLAALGSARPA
jgi:hypothetical protein